MQRRALLLAASAALLVSACQTVVTPDRVPEGGGHTVTVSSEGGTALAPIGPDGEVVGIPVPNGCAPNSAVEVTVDGVLVTGDTDDTSDATGEFAIEIDAPAEPGSYEVIASCTPPEPTEGPPFPEEMAPVNLIVEPDLEMHAEPTTLDPGEEFDVTGTWCVSQAEGSDVPVADVTFEGTTNTIEADDPQPFGESWTTTFTAPTEPGTYEVTATCTYDEVDPDFGFFDFSDIILPPDLEAPAGAQAAATSAAPAAVESSYETVEVVVVAPEEPVAPTPTPTTPDGPRALPVTAQPNFTG